MLFTLIIFFSFFNTQISAQVFDKIHIQSFEDDGTKEVLVWDDKEVLEFNLIIFIEENFDKLAKRINLSKSINQLISIEDLIANNLNKDLLAKKHNNADFYIAVAPNAEKTKNLIYILEYREKAVAFFNNQLIGECDNNFENYIMYKINVEWPMPYYEYR